MKKRIIGGAIICALIIPCFIIKTPIVFDILACIVGVLAMYELINANKHLNKMPNMLKALSLICVPLMAFLNLNGSFYMGIELLSLVIPILLLWLPSLILHKKGYGSTEAFITIMTGLLIGIITYGFITLFTANRWVLLYLIIIQVGTDVFAYLGGKVLGKHKFSKISPNKTIEGCVIGSVFGTALGFIYFLKVLQAPNLVLILFVTLLFSVIGQAGDLLFSLIKRENDIKDFSHIIPGHGGICDRLDSLSLILLLYIIIFRFL
ncbi:MAG: phosphatidate cytidylyltransferase [Bacilli bacterium]|nr:phosphatidate cytidylyltransferase [Bacilli bacterium]